MTTAMLVILGIWFVSLFTGAPIYLTMALAGAAFVFVAGINPIAIPQKITKAADSFPLLAAPMYILMGSLMNSSGITVRIFVLHRSASAGGRAACAMPTSWAA